MTIGIVKQPAVDTSPLARLREPFPESEIRYLPRVWCKACRDSRAGCHHHDRQKCRKCGNNISSAHIDLRYVGHAEATNRLLNVDPEWSWEPAALDEKGLPQYDACGGLWIRLTVCGVTRLGYGHAEGKRGGDAVKEIIGDAIRNAGMRFGMALDLWTSSDLEIAESGAKEESGQPGEADEADPWETSRAAAPGAWSGTATPGPQQAAEERDFAQDARKASTPEKVRKVYREARAAGASNEVLGQITAVGKSLAAGPPPPKPDPAEAEGEVVEGEVVSEEEQAARDAERELRAFAEAQGLDDIARDFEGATGMPLDQAIAPQIRSFLAQLTGNAA